MKPRQRDLRERLLRHLALPDYQPLDKVGLSKALRWPSEQRAALREVLRDLESEGLITRIRKDRYILPDAANLVTGTLEVHRNGTAHVVNEKRDQPDIFITEPNMGTAMHGDKVVARIQHEGREQRRSGDRLEGRVIRILERKNHSIVGTLQQTAKRFLYVIPDDARIPHDVYVHPGEAPLARPPRPGDKVVVKLDPWENRHVNPEGEIIEVLGPASAPGVDMLSIIRKYGLPTEFPEAVQREAERIPETIDPREIERREDLREKFIITIDPDDARDFDDAIDVERTRNGWRLGVHIADVSHYVRLGSALEKEARRRGNSTYLADRVIPMLPERLSNGICSLKPGVDFTPDGRLRGARFARSVIRSAARLSYRQAYAILRGETMMPPLPPAMSKETRGQATVTQGPPVPVDPRVAERVRTAWELASLLRRHRFENGSLDLDFPEVKVWLDGEGRAVKIEKVENDISHQLIEECMLAANEVVAREIKTRRVPSVYRIHEDPAPDRLQEFRELAATYGFRAGDLTQRREVQKLLAAIKGAPEEYALKLQFLKSLKRALYGTAPLGHYGLAKVNYTHFTSPIRRYADLVVHRSLAGILAARETAKTEERQKRRGEAPTNAGALAEAAEHISQTERTSADAEKDSTQLKKMEYFQNQLASRKPDDFRAVVVDVRSYGLFVELPDVGVSGLIHVSDLPDDFYFFDPTRLTFTGKRSRRQFKAGDQLAVLVSRVDAYKRQIDFVLLPEEPPKPAKRQDGKPQRERERRRER
jgi:ribonuclease R